MEEDICTDFGMKRQPVERENTLAHDANGTGLVSKIYKQLTWLHIRQTHNPTLKMGRVPK